MINRFVLASSIGTIEKKFSVIADPKLEWDPKYVVTPGEETLIITQGDPKVLTLSTFGFTPSWAKKPMDIINARAEGNKNPDNNPSFPGGKAIFLKQAFKRVLMHQRCVVLADAYIDRSCENNIPYLLYIRNEERPFGMAGLYDVWTHPDTKSELHTFTIITVPGNTLCQKIGSSRMPVILHKGRERDWLRPSNNLSTILGMLDIYPAEKMNAYPVSKNIFNRGSYDKSILNPLGNRIYMEANPDLLPQRHYGHKQKGAGPGTWKT